MQYISSLRKRTDLFIEPKIGTKELQQMAFWSIFTGKCQLLDVMDIRAPKIIKAKMNMMLVVPGVLLFCTRLCTYLKTTYV